MQTVMFFLRKYNMRDNCLCASIACSVRTCCLRGVKYIVIVRTDERRRARVESTRSPTDEGTHARRDTHTHVHAHNPRTRVRHRGAEARLAHAPAVTHTHPPPTHTTSTSLLGWCGWGHCGSRPRPRGWCSSLPICSAPNPYDCEDRCVLKLKRSRAHLLSVE